MASEGSHIWQTQLGPMSSQQWRKILNNEDLIHIPNLYYVHTKQGSSTILLLRCYSFSLFQPQYLIYTALTKAA
jgi:hypothetical protein